MDNVSEQKKNKGCSGTCIRWASAVPISGPPARAKLALKWLENSYNLDENPGMGQNN